MKKLDLSFVQGIAPGAEPVAIEVPEFGEGMTVNVRPLAVSDYTLLAALNVRSAGNGKVAVKDETERNAMWLPAVAALSAVDDDGALVFGETRAEAIQRAASLPRKYLPAVERIAVKAIELSKLDDEVAAAEEAEKN